MNLENCWASINIYNTFTWSVGNEKKIENTDRREVYYYNSIKHVRIIHTTLNFKANKI